MESQMYIDDDKLSQIVNAVFQLLRMHPIGIKHTDLNKMVSQRLGWKFCHTMLNCKSEFEFIKKFIMGKDHEIELQLQTQHGNNQLMESKEFLIRSKNIMAQFVQQ